MMTPTCSVSSGARHGCPSQIDWLSRWESGLTPGTGHFDNPYGICDDVHKNEVDDLQNWIGLWRVALQRTDVFEAMRADLARVSERVIGAANVRYPEASSLLQDIVQAGGKQLRPLLLLLAGRAYSYEASRDNLVTAAAGVELLHIASLVHDDTVDRSALRRGKPTLNSMLSSGAVILIGDYLFAQSAMLAAATNNPRVVAVFASTLGDICDGQLMEMFEAQRLDQSVAAYEERTYGKTASLFAGAAEMGAILAGASEPEIQHLRTYGSDLGMAFQIVDDILDLTGGTEQLGKPAGNDLRQGTITLPVILYLSDVGIESPMGRRVEAVVKGTMTAASEIDEVVDEIRATDVVHRAARIAERYIDSAKTRSQTVPDRETQELLEELAESAIHRLS
jgi:geranylgeranyl pyrophosphate synthase